MKIRYVVGTFRAAGLEARWGRNSKGAPIIQARNPKSDQRHQRERWWYVDRKQWERAQEVGVLQAFDEHTVLGDLFSI